jgi:outer membrane protein assembly factor BamB
VFWPASYVLAVDKKTGKERWRADRGKGRTSYATPFVVEAPNGIFSASPVAADGKIYFVSETGETIVVKAGRQPEVLARNDLGERLIASPAISNGQLFIRSDGQLFAIGKA